MSIHERTLDVIGAFYDAAMDETLWRGALERLCDLTGSQAASFWVLDGSEQPRLPTFICVNFDMSSIKEYLEHTASFDPTVEYLVAHPHEPIVHDGMVITEQEKDKHPYYDWHNRRIETRFRMVGQTRVAPKVQAGVALHRTRKAGRYEPKDINRFSFLHSHLERALAIGIRFGSQAATQQSTNEWLDRNVSAILFLDERKNIVFANRAARVFESAGDGVSLDKDGISLLHRRDNDKLQSLITQELDNAYLNYVTGDWKKEQEALKAQGIILSYKVLETEGHTPGDWNLILMDQYKDLASLEANQVKEDTVLQQVSGDDQKQMQGYKERSEIREVLGVRIAREIVLEPRM
jgi:hypothetical protein